MSSSLSLGIIGSYVPKKCGIATFSRDLAEGIKENNSSTKFFIAAAEEKGSNYKYPKNVVTRLIVGNKASYTQSFKKLNKLSLDAVILQHEFGLFGGPWSTYKKNGRIVTYPTGSDILPFLRQLKAPLITTFHTVLPDPDRVRRSVTIDIAKASKVVVVITKNSKDILVKKYSIPKDKIVVIPHGVPKFHRENKAENKKKLGLNETDFHLVITGLIGENKGIDLIINALPQILAVNPKVKLLVVGQTHPNILAHDGERYRDSLKKLARDQGVSDSVIFVNKYLETSKLMEYLSVADIYLTLHRDPNQSASGTLAYAVGIGLVTVSTPYKYAIDLLSNGRGFLVPFEDTKKITSTINKLIKDRSILKQTRAKLKSYLKTMSWSEVAKEYLKLIEQVNEN